MQNRKKQIKYYTDLLKENELLLLKSSDAYFKNHYSSSPLAKLTGFFGSEGEAIINKNGEIQIFVDTRYHILVDKQVYNDIKIYKMELGESFFDAFKKIYKKNTILHVPSDIAFCEYLKYDKYFDLRKYDLKEEYLKNKDINKKAKIFEIEDNLNNPIFIEKIEKLKKIYKNISKTIVFNLDEISYLTNLRSFQMANSSNFASILFLDLKNKNYILFANNILKETKIDGLNFKKLNEFNNYITSIEDEIYINLNDISLKEYLLIKNPKELKNNSLATLASIRTKSEIEDIKECFKKTDKAIFAFKKRLKEGLSEYDLSKILEEEFYKIGAKDLSFKTILALNENSASIHYSEPDKNKILKKENLILLDCGAYFKNGFATDITRTFYFGKNPKPIYKKIYTHVLKAFLSCFLSNETNAKKLDSIARDYLKTFEKDGFYFNHGLGHGIGTSVHQNPPRLSMISKDTIKPYQVHSIEPGLYGKSKKGEEFGVRIENCIYSDINFNKISLSKFPFEEVLIDYSFLTPTEIEEIKKWQKYYENN